MARRKAPPAWIYTTSGYQAGYRAGRQAVDTRRPHQNPFFPQDPRHVGWADAIFDRCQLALIRRGSPGLLCVDCG